MHEPIDEPHRAGARIGRALLLIALGLLLVTTACRSRPASSTGRVAACAQACDHATGLVRAMVQEQGVTDEDVLAKRSREMRSACEAECGAGRLEPACLSAAEDFEGIQGCSPAPASGVP